MSKLDPIGLHKVREYNPDRVRTKLFRKMYFSTSVTISPYRRRLRRCDLLLVDVTLTRPSWIPCVTYNRLFFLRDLQLAVLFAWLAICCSFCVTCDWPFFLQGAPNSAVTFDSIDAIKTRFTSGRLSSRVILGIWVFLVGSLRRRWKISVKSKKRLAQHD